MHYFCVAIILGISGFFYYQYGLNDAQIKQLVSANKVLTDKIGSLTAQKTGLIKDNAELTKEISDDKDKVKTLTQTKTDKTAELATAQSTMDAAKKDAAASKADEDAAEGDLDAVQHQPPTNKLGTITLSGTGSGTRTSAQAGTLVTQDQKTFTNCQLVSVTPDYITISAANPTPTPAQPSIYVNILYAFLPGSEQVKFGYDPHRPVELTPDQVSQQEATRIQNDKNKN